MPPDETMRGEPTDGSLDKSPSMEETAPPEGVLTPRRPVRRAHTAPEHGTLIGRYVVLSRLGAGAMGVVVSAYDPQLDRKVAIKLLRSHYRDRSTEQARLQREAQALARLNHPHVVAVHDIGVHERRVFVAMEFVEGLTLRRWLERGERRSWSEVVSVFAAAGRGLAAAHAQGLVHRDFKPENVMIGDDGRVRVMDFGLVRATATSSEERVELDSVELEVNDSLDAPLTRVGSLMGTPAYMAPEQFMNAIIDERTDQFAFCVALYEALYGERPFMGESVTDLATAVMSGECQVPPRGTEVPAWLRQIVMRGLAHAPNERFASMSELLEALEAVEVRRRRKRWAAAAAGLVVVGAGVWGVRHYDQIRRVQACERAGRSIDDSWDDAARSRVREGIEATELAYAPMVAERVMPWLDRYAESWAEQRTEVCMQGQIHEAWTAATVDKALWCMQDRRHRFENLLDRLSNADTRWVRDAVKSASRLRPVARCTDERSLAATYAPPPEDIRSQVTVVSAHINEARRMGEAGDFDGALDAARAARDEAEALGWAPLRVDAMNVVAHLLEKKGSYGEAEDIAIASYMEAVRSDVWEIALATSLDIIFLVGVRQARFDDGMLWAKHAEVAIAKAGDPLGLQEAQRSYNVGTLYYENGDYEQAQMYYERSLSLRRQNLGPDHPDIAAVLSNLGNVESKLERDEQAVQLQEQALAIRIEALGPEHPVVAANLTNLGVGLAGLQRYEEAKASYARASAIMERVYGPDHPDLAAVLNNRGFLHLELEEFEQARPLYERAVEIKEQALGPEHPLLWSSLTGLGTSLGGLGEHAAAIPIYERALALEVPARSSSREAEARAALARALWSASSAEGGDRTRARAMMAKVRDDTRPQGDSKEVHEQAVAWLREHPEVVPTGGEGHGGGATIGP